MNHLAQANISRFKAILTDFASKQFVSFLTHSDTPKVFLIRAFYDAKEKPIKTI